MAADTLVDKFQKAGQPQGDNTDTQSSTPTGSATVPAATERLTHYPIGGGAPAPAP